MNDLLLNTKLCLPIRNRTEAAMKARELGLV